MDKENIIPWYYNKFFMYAVACLLVLTCIFLIYQVFFLFTPIFAFISSIFPPIIISFLFYYMLRPIVYFLEGYHIPRVVSIIGIYIILAVFLGIFFAYIGPFLANQMVAIANTSVDALEKMQNTTSSTLTIGPYTIDWVYELGQRLIGVLKDITVMVSRNFADFLGTITRVTTILAVIPFIVFYLLKEDQDFSSKFLDVFPDDFYREVTKTLKNIDRTLSQYITGLVIIAGSVGIMLFITYLIIGLKYALILSIIALILTSVPFVGPFLAITPALFVGFTENPWMAFKVAIGFIFVQQIEANIISPLVIGQRLNIHPLTIILLLLAAGTLYGFVGLILATPTYALAKVIFQNLYHIYRVRYNKIKATLSQP